MASHHLNSSLTTMFPFPNNLEMHSISSSFFPSNLQHHDFLHELFLSPAENAGPAVPDLSGSAQLISSHRRSSGKDRHSKICTAQGPRDRRMRLSLNVARKFFDLQDLLGFDKASMTVQWLLTMSKSAIKELISESRSESSSSPASEAVERVDAASAKGARTVAARRASLQSRVGRESREKARARARERTLEKKTKRNQRSDLKSGLECAVEMNSDQNRSNSSSVYNHDDIVGPMAGSVINLCDYNLHNAVGNYLFQDSWENMSFISSSSCIDERFLDLGEL